jgi:hypothetical protein
MTTVNQHIGMSATSPYYAGDDLVVRITVGSDISGSTVRWEAFPWGSGPKFGEPDDEPVIAKATGGDGIAITDGAAGTFEVTIIPADTATLSGLHYHEAQVVLASGRTYTVSTGLFRITKQRVV